MKQAKIKPTDKILQVLKGKLFSNASIIDIPTISLSDLKSLDISTEYDSVVIGNISLTKSSGFLSGTNYKIEIISDDLDFDGKKTSENKALISYLQGEFRRNTKIIKAQDLRDFNVNTKRSNIQVGNFQLSESILGGINSLLGGKIEKSFDLNLADKRFGADNKIINSKITFKDVRRVMSDFKIKQVDYDGNGEVAINKLLETHFQEHFENASRSGGAKKSFYDLIIGDPENNQGYAIELKLASSITSSERDRISGQVKKYIKTLQNNNLILVIIGPKSDYSLRNIKDLEDEVESDFKCFFIYHNVQ